MNEKGEKKKQCAEFIIYDTFSFLHPQVIDCPSGSMSTLRDWYDLVVQTLGDPTSDHWLTHKAVGPSEGHVTYWGISAWLLSS